MSACAWVEYPLDLYILNSIEAEQESSSLTSIEKFEGEVNVFPNPATDVVNISVDFGEATDATVSVSDITGKQIAVLANNLQVNAGVQNFVWNANAVEGVYVVRIKTTNGEITKRVSVVR